MGLLPAPASAQQIAPQPIVPGSPTATINQTGNNASSQPLSRFDLESDTQCDIFFGRNLRGPYRLAWKNIRPGSELVLRDGVPLHRDADYTLDAAAGALSLATPLQPDQIVRITYRCNTLDSAPNQQEVAVPLAWDLWHQNNNHLTFSTVYRPDTDPVGTRSASAPFSSTLQFVDGMRLLPTSDLTTGLFLDLHGGDWLGRSGARLAEHTKLRCTDLGFTYSRAGALFAQEQASGLSKGREILEATGSLIPWKLIKLGATFRQTTELPDTSHPSTGAPPTSGTKTTKVDQSLALNLPKNGGQLDAARTQTQVDSPNNSVVITTHDTVNITRVLAKGTQATIAYDAITTQTDTAAASAQPSPGSYAQKTVVSIKSQPNKQLSLTGAFSNALGASTAEDTETLHLEALPFTRLNKLKLTADWQDQFQSDGVNRSRQAIVTLPLLPLAHTELSGGIKQTGAPGKELVVGLINAKTRPLRYLEITADTRLRDGTLKDGAPDPDAVNTYDLKVTLSPWKHLQLIGSLSHNPSTDSSPPQHLLSRSVGMDTEFGIFKMHGQYGTEQEYLTSRLSNTMQYGLDLRITRWDTLSTGYQGSFILDKDLTATNTYSLGFTHRLASAVDLTISGSMVRRSLNGSDTNRPELKAQAKLGVHF